MNRILLVEDELSLAEGIKLNLEMEGLPCVWITRGDEALKRILNETFDLVLLDVMLPGMDGFEVARQLKAAPNTAHIPIIFMTGLTETEVNRQAEAWIEDEMHRLSPHRYSGAEHNAS